MNVMQVPIALQFHDREQEQADGTQILADPQTVVVLVLTGVPGVGKTTLAQQLALKLREQFPDQLWVEFGGTEGALSVADALTDKLLALGMRREELPGTERELSAAFRSRTASRRVLVVLDGVVKREQVQPFIPGGPGSAVLVTSTSQLSQLKLDGARHVHLKGFGAPDAEGYLRLLCGDRVGDQSLSALAEVCDGLPIALRAAAGRLITDPDRVTVDQLVAQISGTDAQAFTVDEKDQPAEVFDLAYHGLSPQAAELYREWGVLRFESASPDMLSAREDRSGAIAQLVEAGLVQRRGNRLWMHRLFRRHAEIRGETDGVDTEAVLRGALTWLLAGASAADLAKMGEGRYRCTPVREHLTSEFADAEQAMAWLDAERENLVLAVRRAVELGWNELAWQLAETATTLYVNRRYLVDWTETSELGAKAAGLAHNTAAEARLRSFATRAMVDLGDRELAQAELTEAQRLVETTDDLRLQASIHELWGRFWDATDHGRAVTAYTSAIELFERVQDLRGVAFVTYFLAAAQHANGDHELALTTVDRALELITDDRMLGRAVTTQASILAALGRLPEAAARFDVAIDLLRADPFHEAVTQELRGDLLDDRDALRRAYELYQSLGSSRAVELGLRLN
ncbi:NACHT domain-containing protein [Pseudonocardiaceae bacterium YIM PH 21723]|nr:NACHT domain-containing protein [Pseudonocardiaceae bacterium YIM PH 21723]